MWTLAEAKEYLQIWVNASLAVAGGQSYKVGRRELTRANLGEIQKMINYWRTEVNKLEAGRGGGARVLRAIPRDL